MFIIEIKFKSCPPVLDSKLDYYFAEVMNEMHYDDNDVFTNTKAEAYIFSSKISADAYIKSFMAAIMSVAVITIRAVHAGHGTQIKLVSK